jgi:hypothetical protein
MWRSQWNLGDWCRFQQFRMEELFGESEALTRFGLEGTQKSGLVNVLVGVG